MGLHESVSPLEANAGITDLGAVLTGALHQAKLEGPEAEAKLRADIKQILEQFNDGDYDNVVSFARPTSRRNPSVVTDKIAEKSKEKAA